MEALIVTGASRGLGSHLIDQAKHQYQVRIGLSRGDHYEGPAEETATSKIRVDLSNRKEVEATAAALTFGLKEYKALSRITLIHNAGTLEPVKTIVHTSGLVLEENIGINLLAPMILTARIVSFGKENGIDVDVLFISSGAAQHPLSGLSAYSTTKAGLEMFARCLSKEEPEVKVLTINPGTMDTHMQDRMKSVDEADCPDVQLFRDFRAAGKLVAPSIVAAKIIKLIAARNWESGTLVDVRSL